MANASKLVSVPDNKPTSLTKRMKHAAAIDRTELFLARRLPEMVNLLLELARGVVLMEEKDGKPKIYRKEPDRQALTYLTDRIMGKTPQRMEITGADEGPVEYIAWAAPTETEAIEGEFKDVTDEAEA